MNNAQRMATHSRRRDSATAALCTNHVTTDVNVMRVYNRVRAAANNVVLHNIVGAQPQLEAIAAHGL